MPLIRYKCNLCSNYIEKIIFNVKDIKGAVPCQCGGFLERSLSGPSSSSSEKVENGNLVKPVYFDSKKYALAKEQGDKLLKELKDKEKLNEEVKKG